LFDPVGRLVPAFREGDPLRQARGGGVEGVLLGEGEDRTILGAGRIKKPGSPESGEPGAPSVLTGPVHPFGRLAALNCPPLRTVNSLTWIPSGEGS